MSVATKSGYVLRRQKQVRFLPVTATSVLCVWDQLSLVPMLRGQHDRWGYDQYRRDRDSGCSFVVLQNLRVWVLTSEFNWIAGTIVSAEDTEAMVRTADRQVRFFAFLCFFWIWFSVSRTFCFVQYSEFWTILVPKIYQHAREWRDLSVWINAGDQSECHQTTTGEPWYLRRSLWPDQIELPERAFSSAQFGLSICARQDICECKHNPFICLMNVALRSRAVTLGFDIGAFL